MTTWPRILAATVLLQATSSFLTRLIPTLGPVVTAEAGISSEFVGHLSALAMVGTLIFLIIGGPFVRRTGPIRVLQLAGLSGSIGALFIALPHWQALVVASLLIGVAYGPSAIAGSNILDHHTPRHRRSLVFSIKQAGVPLGGAIAGVVLPLLMQALGWQGAIIAAAAISAIPLLMVQPLRRDIDSDRDTQQRVSPRFLFSLSNVMEPFRTLRLAPELPALNVVGASLSVAQGATFAFLVTLGVEQLGLDLPRAGLLFAAMQIGGVPGRIFLGWFCDRLGSAMLALQLVSWLTTAACLVLALATPAWPLWSMMAVAILLGLSTASWMGIYMAEIARLVPAAVLNEAIAGSTVIPTIFYAAGPAAFATLVSVTGEYDVALCVMAAVAFLGGVALVVADRRAKAAASHSR